MEFTQDNKQDLQHWVRYNILDFEGKVGRRQLWRVLLPWLAIIFVVSMGLYTNMIYKILHSLQQKGVYLENGNIKPGLEDYVYQYMAEKYYKLYGKYVFTGCLIIATGFTLMTSLFVRRLNDVCRPNWVVYVWMAVTWFYTIINSGVLGDGNLLPILVLQIHQFSVGLYAIMSIYLLVTFMRSSVMVPSTQESETPDHLHTASV